MGEIDELTEWLLVNLLDWKPPDHPDTRDREAEYTRHISEISRHSIHRHDRWLSPQGHLFTIVSDPDGSGGLPDLSGSWEGAGLIFEAMQKRPNAVREDFVRRLLETLHGQEPRTIGWACFVNVNPGAVSLAAQAALKAEGGH